MSLKVYFQQNHGIEVTKSSILRRICGSIMPTEGIQMSYLKDFQTQISNRDYAAFTRLWEEYCENDRKSTQVNSAKS